MRYQNLRAQPALEGGHLRAAAPFEPGCQTAFGEADEPGAGGGAQTLATRGQAYARRVARGGGEVECIEHVGRGDPEVAKVVFEDSDLAAVVLEVAPLSVGVRRAADRLPQPPPAAPQRPQQQQAAQHGEQR